MGTQNAFGLAMLILGIICAAANYATHYITWLDDEFNTKMWMFGVICPLFTFLLIAAACWLYCLIVG